VVLSEAELSGSCLYQGRSGALGYTAFNASLNEVSNVETRSGSFLEPVAGEQFDLVVANPRYVVSPESAYLFRDAGIPRTQYPNTLDQPEAYANALDRWLDYYRALGIEHLGYACLVLRKRSDGRDGWPEAQELPQAALRPAGRHVKKLFVTHDRLVELGSGDELLGRRLRVVDNAVVTQDTRFQKGRWQPENLIIRIETGLPFSAELDPPTGRMIRELDGTKTLQEALVAVAEGDATLVQGLSLARRMLEIGFLELAD
jgi:hypothetical protein